jgi:hypothetical protein
MYSEFIIDINKSPQYEEVGDREWCPNCKGEMTLRQSSLEGNFRRCKVWNRNFSIKNLRGEKGKWKI